MEHPEYFLDEDLETQEPQLCYYCNITNQSSLVKCTQKGCNLYFCNNPTEGEQTGTHIFQHLDIRGHNSINFNDNFEVSCFKCDQKNIFTLCYHLDGSQITILCRTNCLLNDEEAKTIKDWRPILSEKSIDECLVPAFGAGKFINLTEISEIEFNLAHGNIKNPLDIGPESFKRISLKYNMYDDYKETFESLLDLEHEYDKFYSSIENALEVEPTWINDYRKFTYKITEEKMHFNSKDEVVVSADLFKANGVIEKVSQGEVTVELLLGKKGKDDLRKVHIKSVYTDVAYNRMIRGLKSFRSMESSLKNLILGYDVKFFEYPIGDIDDFSVPNLPRLNSSQQSAVRKALTTKISLIQGPPGTGKTVTTASIVYHFSKILNQPSEYEKTKEEEEKLRPIVMNAVDVITEMMQELKLRKKIKELILAKSQGKSDYELIEIKLNNNISSMEEQLKKKNQEKAQLTEKMCQIDFKLSKTSPDTGKKMILVCAPSNVAVDHLVRKCIQAGLKVVRFFSKSKEDIENDISYLSFHNIFKAELEKPENKIAKELFFAKKAGALDKGFKIKYNKLEEEIRNKILTDVEVVCCTCIGALDHRLQGLKFHIVIIDEACQSQEPETLIPLLTKPEQIVLVGDHFQLGPIIKCKEAEKAGLENSLFKRLIDLGNEKTMLNYQYRMHPAIALFPSLSFYNKELKNGVTEYERHDRYSNFAWPSRSPVFFYHVDSFEEHSSSGKSFVNRGEAETVLEIIKRLGSDAEIGIITFYDAQRVTILNYTKSLESSGFNIEIASVDSFQGREKDYIILSCVRANERLGVGFLGNYRRLNVAITRARYGLIICGHAPTLARSPTWNYLLNFYQDNGLVFAGTIDNLNRVNIDLRSCKDFTFESNFIYAEHLKGDIDLYDDTRMQQSLKNSWGGN
ncbi:hypothetical protein SteCoe_12106 [Stentor coeruleus]|uniref:Upf1 domain-containing protein n=1 Tax=Stentor coeruleus TaxID=5963 RepID=A0A1R2CBN7_9CILI|nr:hypothetical protein SteCoe_12106 [Stentor coeruleus]